MAEDRLTLMIGSLGASLGIALWMSIMVQAALSIPVVGFMVMIPAGLVVFSVYKVLTDQNRKAPPELLI
ncbi:MAG: hypothetical protein AAGF74_17530 [Pseudomonadota bacterium]